MTTSFVFVFQDQLGLEERRASEGTKERKEIGAQRGQRENPALAPAHGVESMERRFGRITGIHPCCLTQFLSECPF